MSARERWIVVANCQTTGLANSLGLLAPGVDVEGLDVALFRQDVAGHARRFADYDRVLAGRSALDAPGADFSRARRFDELPEIAFTAFHPDMTYVVLKGELLAGPLDVYHSALGFLLHQRGLSVQAALPVFNAATYAASGYLDRWTGERDGLVGYCGFLRLDVAQAVRRWGRRGAFMYSTNHPRIHVLYDVARLYLEREGYAPQVSDLLPHDNLAHGAAFAVYPEVGEALGVPGAYLFKRAYAYSQMTLPEYLAECFAVYDRHPPGALAPHAVFRAATDRTDAALDALGLPAPSTRAVS